MASRASALRADNNEDFYVGLRMSSDEYFALPEVEHHWFELIDGVVVMFPNPTPRHQIVTVEVMRQVANYLTEQPVGQLFVQTDTLIAKSIRRGDLVFRPDIAFFSADRLRGTPDHLTLVPDMVAEILSPTTARLDQTTKFEDYERFGVQEYWLIDPVKKTWAFYRLKAGRFVRVKPVGSRFKSTAVPGFVLDLALVRRAMK